jgi:manganese/zinc/iron transport system ATP- binding protein
MHYLQQPVNELKRVFMENTSTHQVAIIIQDLTAWYRTEKVLDAVACDISKGSMCAIVGPNGAGKSTLMNVLVGLHTGYQGTVRFHQDMTKHRSCIAYVPQRSQVDWDFPASVYDVVMMGRYPKLGFFRRPTAVDHERVRHVLALVSMDQLSDRPIGQLSGGQQQRVFFARALAQDAQIYFLDEPFAGVDAATELDLVRVLKAEVVQGKTVVVVHHDLNTLSDYFDHLVLLNKKIIAHGSLQSVFTKENIMKTYGRAPLCIL